MRVSEEREQLKKAFLSDAQGLANIYWMIRASRFHRHIRKHYRRAQKEKGRLAALGYDLEAIRLYRLWLRNPRLEHRFKRFEEHFHKPVQMTLF